ncbi:MAG: LysM peptidoglycan-binding domain-containing protein, partial [Actinomycetota bacterium]|nr:LysM peptidoglycan-binding domain-containing protein [Actinomycetota bacterium]
VTMHRLGPVDVSQPPAVPLAPERDTAAAAQWTVKPGECFWSIADRVLTERLGRSPSDAEIVPYWQRLIDANRHELVQRDNPDLVLPGQGFTVPAP